MSRCRIARSGFEALLVVAWLLAAQDPAHADCALIPAAIKMLPSVDGGVDRPFAAPLDTVTVYSDSACKPEADQPHFDPVAANNQVTLSFEPPTGVTPPIVAPIVPSAMLHCGSDRCFALEFQIPDTTSLAGPFPLTGPARIEVRNLAAGAALVAVIEDLYEPTRGCNPENRSLNLFEKFTVLPPANAYIENASATLNATVDGSGALLIPLDYTGVLASPLGSGSGTVRLLSITADLPNGLLLGNGLAGADGSFIRPPRFSRHVRAFSFNGRPIPPLLKVASSHPMTALGIEYGDSIVGSVDFVDSVLRIAKVAPNPSAPASGLQIFALQGEQAPSGLTLQAGVGPVVLTGVSLAAGAAAPLNSVVSSQRLAVVARDEVLEQAFGTGNQNSDGDSEDRVVHFVDLDNDTEVTTGMAVQEAETKAILVSEGTKVAFLQSEIYEDRTDFVGDGDYIDGVFRVWTSDGSHPFCGGSACELTAGLPAYSGYPLPVIQGPAAPTAIAFSGIADPSRYVFFLRYEANEAPLLTTRHSHSYLGLQLAAVSRNPTVSNSGLMMAFTSQATNVIPTATSGSQIFKRDVFAETNQLISSTSFGGSIGGNGPSDNATIDGPGNTVGFDSLATNLAVSDDEGLRDVFVWSNTAGAIFRVSEASPGVGGNGSSSNAYLANGGGAVVYQSGATNLVAGDTNGVSDIFWNNLSTGNQRVSLTNAGAQANGASTNAAVSSDGSLVVFDSLASNLGSAADGNGVSDVYLRDRINGTTERISRGYAGAEANGASTDPDLSFDGTFVVFSSSATNLLPPGVTLNQPTQCYKYDRATRSTTLVSATLGREGANAPCLNPSIDVSGRYVLFASEATNLDPGATTASMRIYFHDSITGNILVASGDSTNDIPTAGPTGTRSDIGVVLHGIVVYDTIANDLGVPDSNGVQDVYAAQIQTAPSLNTGPPFADADNADAVLYVFDTVNGTYTNTGLPVAPANPYGDVAVGGGRAAVSPSGLGGPGPGYIWDQEAGGVLRSMSPTLYPFRVAISDTTYCVLDLFSGTLWVGNPATGAAQNTGIAVTLSASSVVKAVGNRCIVRSSAGTLQFATRTGGAPTVTNTGVSARDFQVGDDGIAFRTCEVDAAADLNGDSDTDDCVMRFWDFDAPVHLIDTRHLAVPCTFPGCDPFFEPYRVGPGIVSFVTSEPKEIDVFGSGAVGVTCLPTSPFGVCDKTGDEDGNDVAVEIYNLASGKAQVFPVNPDNPPRVDPFPKVVSGADDNLLVIQLPAELLGADYSTLPPEQLITLIVGDPEGDGVFEADGNTDPLTTVVDKCQETANLDQTDLDGDGLGTLCDRTKTLGLANDNPVGAPAPAEIPGTDLCDLNRSGIITRAEVDQIWADRGTPISQPADHIVPLDTIPDPTDDRDRDGDGEVTAVDFRLCLADCSAQGAGCPLTESSAPPATGGYKPGCGLLGIEALVVLLPWAWRRRRMQRKLGSC